MSSFPPDRPAFPASSPCTDGSSIGDFGALLRFFPDQPVRVRLRLLELRGMEAFLVASSHWDGRNVDDFRVLLRSAISSHGVQQAVMAKELRVEQGTMRRWLHGQHKPSTLVAKAVVQWVLGDVEARARALRNTLEGSLPGVEIPDWTAGRRRADAVPWLTVGAATKADG